MPEADGEIKIKDKIYALRRQQCGSLICVNEFVKSPLQKRRNVFADVRIQLRLMQVFAPSRKQHRSSDPQTKKQTHSRGHGETISWFLLYFIWEQ